MGSFLIVRRTTSLARPMTSNPPGVPRSRNIKTPPWGDTRVHRSLTRSSWAVLRIRVGSAISLNPCEHIMTSKLFPSGSFQLGKSFLTLIFCTFSVSVSSNFFAILVNGVTTVYSSTCSMSFSWTFLQANVPVAGPGPTSRIRFGRNSVCGRRFRKSDRMV